MDLTVHLLTKNNAKTIAATLNSLAPLHCRILITDLGSTDQTVALCESAGHRPIRMPFESDRSVVLNGMVARSVTEWQLHVQPWEILLQPESLATAASAARLCVIQGQTISKELRLWRKSCGFRFVNPVFEFLEGKSTADSGAVLASTGQNLEEALVEVRKWKKLCPILPDPFYYETCVLLSLGRLDEFIVASEHYMFLDPKPSRSTTMNRYYYAMVQLRHKRLVRPTLQNIALCLSHNPLMAEFWCLVGDVYYHLLDKFVLAKEFYENAILLGSRRLQSDDWPMDISKYDEYPTKMIESCRRIVAAGVVYSDSSQ
jgi:hypothetical protein